jgi:hypothetical protein
MDISGNDKYIRRIKHIKWMNDFVVFISDDVMGLWYGRIKVWNI